MQGQGRHLEEEIEALEQEAECHKHNRRPHPGEKGALVRGVVGVVLDHRASLRQCLEVNSSGTKGCELDALTKMRPAEGN